MISGLVDETQKKIRIFTENFEEAKRQLHEKESSMATEQEEYKRFKSWADIYDMLNFETKKMFISYFVKAIYVYRDYEMDMEFNFSFEEFKHFSVK